jgi:hypothetical protein
VRRGLIVAPNGVVTHVTSSGARELPMRDELQYERFARELTAAAGGGASFDLVESVPVGALDGEQAEYLIVDIDRLDEVPPARPGTAVVVLRTGPNGSVRMLQRAGVVACADFFAFAGWSGGAGAAGAAAGGAPAPDAWLVGHRNVADRLGAHVSGNGPVVRLDLPGVDLPHLLWRYLAAVSAS